MSFELRQYQQSAVTETLNAVEELESMIAFEEVKNKDISIIAVTSFGKSIVILKIAEKLALSGYEVGIMFPVATLIDQFIDTAKAINLDISVIASGYDKLYVENAPIQICMIQTLVKRAEKLNIKFDIVIQDEWHKFNATKSMETLNSLVNHSIRIGTTATNYNAFGWKIPSYKDIITATGSDLLEQGFWNPIKFYTTRWSEKIDTSNMKISSSGDFTQTDTDLIVATDNYINKTIKVLDNANIRTKKTILFCSSIAQGEMFKLALNKADYACELVHSKIPKKKCNAILKAFADNTKYIDPDIEDTLFTKQEPKTIKLIINVNMLTTGYSVEDIEAGVVATIIGSRNKWNQQQGRLRRIHDSKTHSIVIDLGNNLSRLGFDNDDFNPPIKTDDRQQNRINLENEISKWEMPLLSSILPDTLDNLEPFEITRDWYNSKVEELEHIEQEILSDMQVSNPSRISINMSQEEIELQRVKDMIRILKTTKKIENIINAYIWLHIYYNGLPISRHGKEYTPTPEFILDKLIPKIETYPEKRRQWMKALRTRCINILKKPESKLFGIAYFFDFLEENYLQEQELYNAQQEPVTIGSETITDDDIPF